MPKKPVIAPDVDKTCELLSTAMQFIPADEPGLRKDLAELCHDVRTFGLKATRPVIAPSDVLDKLQRYYFSVDNENSIAVKHPQGGWLDFDDVKAALAATQPVIAPAQPVATEAAHIDAAKRLKELMLTEQAATQMMCEAWSRLKELGWCEAPTEPTRKSLPEKTWWTDGDFLSMPSLFKPLPPKDKT